jgi:hypothetical protein
MTSSKQYATSLHLIWNYRATKFTKNINYVKLIYLTFATTE